MPLLVQEAACAERVVVLKVRAPGRTSLVIVAAAGAGLLDPEVRRALWGGKLPAGAVRQRAREDALEGAMVVALTEREAFVDQRGDPRVLRAVNGRVVVTDGTAASCDGDPFFGFDRAELEARGRRIAEAVAAESIDLHRADVQRLLDRAAQKITRRREAIRGDLDKIAQADEIATQAQWLVAAAARAPRGATSLTVTDWSTGEAVEKVFPLDPSKSAKEQVDAMFKRAKRLRLGARVAQDRLAQTETQLAAIVAAKEAIAAAEALPAIEAAMQSAKRAAPRDVTLPASQAGAAGSTKSRKPAARTPFRAFFARSGRRLMVGKGAADNDELTLHHARPHDLWLHAKDRTGGHVIVPLDRGQTCSAEDLVDAAHLAAHFSEARDEKVVDVQYTDRRYLRKPKGSAAGLVVVDREKVLVLRVEPDILRGLLEREDV
ncbi:MAG: NFACT RNA binding domain-containing protein [Labilithrix sp.]